jgi:hypothetical protein
MKEKTMGQLVDVKEKKKKQDYNQQEGTINISMEKGEKRKEENRG